MIAGLVALLALLPALVGLGVREASGLMAVGFGSLAGVVGGVKLVALAWGLAARPGSLPASSIASASTD